MQKEVTQLECGECGERTFHSQIIPTQVEIYMYCRRCKKWNFHLSIPIKENTNMKDPNKSKITQTREDTGELKQDDENGMQKL